MSTINVFDVLNISFLGFSISTHLHLLVDVLPRASIRSWKKPINILVWTCVMGFLVAFNDYGGYFWGNGSCRYRFASVWFYASQKYGYTAFLTFKAYHVMNNIVSSRMRSMFLAVMGTLWGVNFIIYQVYAFYLFNPFVDPTGFCVISFRDGFTVPYFIDAIICVLASGAFALTLRSQLGDAKDTSTTTARVDELRRKSIYAAFVSVGVHFAEIIYFLGFQVPLLNLPIFLAEQVVVDLCMVHSNRLSQASGGSSAGTAAGETANSNRKAANQRAMLASTNSVVATALTSHTTSKPTC